MRDKCSVAFLRVSQLMMGMIDAIEDRDKTMLIKLSRHLDEDTKTFIGEALVLAGVTDKELDELEPSDNEDEELIRKASSAIQIRNSMVIR
jgi:hypothetical protein